MKLPTSLRERNRIQTRAAIRQAAISLVLERGLAEVTVESIAEAAGVSPRTFFNHFRTKPHALVTSPAPLEVDALDELVAGQAPLVNDLCTLIVRHSRESVPQRALIRQAAEIVTRHPELNPLMLEGFREFEAELADAIARRLAGAGVPTSGDAVDCDPTPGAAAPADPAAAALAATCVAMYRSASRRWLATGCEVPLDGMVEEAFAALRLLEVDHRPGPGPTTPPTHPQLNATRS